MINQKIIYLDNAATSFPKPESVYAAHDAYFRSAGNPGRGAHTLALHSARAVFEARTMIAEFLGADRDERLIFTPSCTYSINMVLKGVGLKHGDCVFTSALEHNSVMRTLKAMEGELDLKIVVLPYADRGIIDPQQLSARLDADRPKLCVFAESSNVTGERIPIQQIAEICAAKKVPLLIDAAQTAGSEANCLRHSGITYWAAPGHKGLMGAPGAGLLYVRADSVLEPLVCGGTGSSSESFEMPNVYPDRLEPGTIGGPAIAALGAGVEFVHKTGATLIVEHEHSLATQFRQWCYANDWIKLAGKSYSHGTDVPSCAASPVVSFSIDGHSPDRVADALNLDHGIAVRPGLHCAAQAHQALGTTSTGLVRVSFGFFNTTDELTSLCDALQLIHKS
jgi:cysteine desulfurase family protein